MNLPIFGGVEIGGSEIVCAIGTSPMNILNETIIFTRSPSETLPEIIQFFLNQQKEYGNITAIGIASFGPLDLNPRSPTYGQIISTPKSGWVGTDVIHPFQNALNIPVYLDTDVNGAALGEWLSGAGRGFDTILYMTVGTGIGVGAIFSGKIFHGSNHPEMGHMRIPHDFVNDPFVGICPFHGDCLEGLASGHAMELRWLSRPENLPYNHPAWALEAQYLAYATTNLIFTFSPQRIILGGGIMRHLGLLKRIQQETNKLVNGYGNFGEREINQIMVEPMLGDRAGVCGAIGLAMQANQ
jgi:fructokinase